MPIYASYKKMEFDPAPQGLWQGVCCDVEDLGMQKTEFNGVVKEQHKIRIYWLIEELNPKTGKPFMVSQRYTLSLDDKANLKRDLEIWRGRKFTAEEREKFDVEKLIGANCQVSVVHNIKDEGQVWANVAGIVPIRSNMAKMRVPDDFIRRKDHDTNSNGASDAAEPEEETTPF